MAYTAVPTITTGDVATAAWGNTYIKSNFAAGVPDIFTADGEVAIGTGANAAESVAILDSSNFLKRAYGGLEVALSDPDADRILFWDDGAGDYAYLTPGTNLEIDGTTMNASGAVAATQAEMEAASSTTVFVVPGRTQYHPGVAKVWVLFHDTNVVDGSYNVASITDTSGTGEYNIVFSTPFSTLNYARVGMSTSDRICFVDDGTAPLVGTLSIEHAIASNYTVIDVGGTTALAASFLLFGDQ